MRKRLLIPLAIVVALGGYGLVPMTPQECEDQLCTSSGGCREMEWACCETDPCEVCICD